MKHLSGGASVEDVLKLTPRLADLSMHLQVHFQSELVHTVGQQLLSSSVPVVIDHMGRVDAQMGEQHADFQALMRLLDQPHVHVKVSGIDRIEASSLADGVSWFDEVSIGYLECQWHRPYRCC